MTILYVLLSFIFSICIFISLTEASMETVSVQTESIELSANKQDVSVQFTYLIPSNGMSTKT